MVSTLCQQRLIADGCAGSDFNPHYATVLPIIPLLLALPYP